MLLEVDSKYKMSDEARNLGNAAVIIACIYFLFKVSSIWAKIGLILLIIFAISTWGIYHFSKEHKDLIQSQILELKTRARLNNSNAAFISANALLMREQAIWLKTKRSQ